MPEEKHRPQVFISYSRNDLDFIEKLASDLREAETDLDVWYDLSGLDGGARWRIEIEKAIRASQYVIVVLSPDSIVSEWVELEFFYARKHKKKIIPLIHKHCDDLPMYYLNLHFIDVQGRKYKQNFSEILRALGDVPEPVPDDKLKTLESQAIQYELKGDFWNALKVWYEIRSIDPSFPRVDIKINEMEEEIRREKEMREHTRREKVEWQSILPKAMPILRVLGVFGVIVVLLWGGSWVVPKLIKMIPTQEASVTPTEEATPSPVDLSTEIIDDFGVEMIRIPKGEFIMGSERGNDDEKPAHVLALPDFYIDKYEVTNGLYEICVDSGVCSPPKYNGSKTHSVYYGNSQFDNYPVIYVDWHMARAYCEWRGARLPTEAEWEKAARGTDGRSYPWGEAIDISYANFLGFRADAVSVGGYSKGASLYGVYDMAGNVWEWVSSRYMPYPYNLPGDREKMDIADYRVKRGGSWKSDDVGSTIRQKTYPTSNNDDTGFRCAGDAIP